MAANDPSSQEALALFEDLEREFPTSSLASERWQLLAIAAISAGGHPGLAKDLYLYLISRPEYQTPEQRQALMRRLREALVKLVSVVGVPKPLEAIFCMAEVEREEDKDYSFSREHWNSGPENQQRGRDWLATIYRHNDNRTAEMMAAHKDFRWLSIEITYGLYLSDHSILDGIDTELVVLSGIMLQNLKRETGWHLRGMRRIGVAKEDVVKVWELLHKVARFCGVTLNKVPRVEDIEHEVDEKAN